MHKQVATKRSVHATSLEVAKFWSDYIKLITTLSTGSILLITTFLEKLFIQPRCKGDVVAALVCLIISITGSFIGFFLLADVVDDMDDTPVEKSPWKYSKFMLVTIGVMASGGFGLGIILLAVFAIINLS
jgi:hypothetical protein